MKVVFMGTSDFSVPALDALVAAGHQIVAVYSQPPRPAGRGQKDRSSAVQRRAEALGLEVRTPRSLKSTEAQSDFAQLGADVAVVVAYGLILPAQILSAPKFGCLNIHASLLPRWRGAAPIHRAIMAGDAKTGICIMQMDEGLDTGPVLLRNELDIGPDATTGTLHDMLAEIGAPLIVRALSELAALPRESQPLQGVTYAAKISKDEARIDWTRDAAVVDRQIRGLSPFPGAWCMAGDERLKLLHSEVVAGLGAPGQVLDAFSIACGSGAVRILQAQRHGKRPMEADDLLRGMTLPDRLD